MKYKKLPTPVFESDAMTILAYGCDNTESDSVSFANITLRPGYAHGRTSNSVSKRIYSITAGRGTFTIGLRKLNVEGGDIVVVPKGVTYNFIAKSDTVMILTLVSLPAYDPRAEVAYAI